jgi:type IV fimbrial biogenesis protein FimT
MHTQRIHQEPAMQSQRTPNKAQQRGVSLVEAMSVTAILSIVVGAGLPSFSALRQRADLAGVAAQLETDVQFARSQATALGHPVQLTLRESAGATCYMVHTGPAASCSCGGIEAVAACSGDAQLLRAVSLAASGAVQVRSASKSIAFDPLRGTVTPTATLRVEARDGRAIHQVVNLLGRVRSCSPGGRLAGEAVC